jgi:hypothetical protein
MSKVVLYMSMSVDGFITARGEPAPGSARYGTDGIASCVAQAKAAAGGRDILLGGAATAQECLRAGLLDEMELRVLDGPGVQHLRYRVRKEG